MPITQTLIGDSIAQAMLAEFETQAPITRRFLERIPEDKLTWKSHEKSMTAGQLAYSYCLVRRAALFALCKRIPRRPRIFRASRNPKIARRFCRPLNEGVSVVREILPTIDDAEMAETWRLIAGGKEVLAQPRAQFLRDIMFSHVYQHRGQFSVYLRLLNVPVPASWGPSADRAAVVHAERLIGRLRRSYVPFLSCDCGRSSG